MASQPRWALLRHRNFRLLWAGESLSQAGAMVGHTVLPLIAIHTLAVGAFEMGLLVATETLAFLLFGLPAGVWIDRWRRKAVMTAAALTRAVLLLSLPLAWWFELLAFGQMLVVAFVAGLCTLFFDVACQSFLPSVLDRDDLVRGNAALQSSQSVAHLSGPPVGGVLAQVLGPVTAVLAVAASYLGAALTISRITVHGRDVVAGPAASLSRAVRDGLAYLWRHRILRAVALSTMTCNFFAGVQHAVLVIFLFHTNGLSSAVIGIIFAFGGLGGVVAALTAARWTRRLGRERTLWACLATTMPLSLLIPLAEDGPWLGPAVVGYAAVGYGSVLFNITQLTYRQIVCPDHLLGRLNASTRFLTWGVLPLGAMLGGVLGSGVGIQPTMWVASIGIACGPVFLLLSPLLRASATDQSVPAGNQGPRGYP